MIPFRTLCARLRTAIKDSPEVRERLGGKFLRTLNSGSAYAYKIDAAEFLKACALVGVEPMTGARIAMTPAPDDFNPMLLSVACAMHRHWADLDQRPAAKAMGISAATVCRIENGTPVSIEAVRAVCEFTSTKPLDYLRSERRRAA